MNQDSAGRPLFPLGLVQCASLGTECHRSAYFKNVWALQMSTLLKICLGKPLLLRTEFASLTGREGSFSANDMPLEHLSKGTLLQWPPFPIIGSMRLNLSRVMIPLISLPQSFIFSLSFPETDKIQEASVRLNMAPLCRMLRCLRKVDEWLKNQPIFSADIPSKYWGLSSILAQKSFREGGNNVLARILPVVEKRI